MASQVEQCATPLTVLAGEIMRKKPPNFVWSVQAQKGSGVHFPLRFLGHGRSKPRVK
jgi:hypothetical protein